MQQHYINKKKIKLGFVFVCLAWVIQPVASAQSDEEIRESVAICQHVADLSYRLACYDRAFPPPSETANSAEPMPSREELVVSGSAVREQERQLDVVRREFEVERQRIEEFDSRAQIVEVEQPSLRTSRFITSDGRVFVQRNATRVNRLPELPFDVGIETRLAGTTILLIPDPATGRDQRVRVLLEE